MLRKLLLTPFVAFTLLVGVFIAPTIQVFADGNGSPSECIEKDNDNVYGSIGGNADILSKDVGEGYVVTGVCIKSGSNMFDGNQHSQVLTSNGYYEDDCYKVKGIGTQTVTVKRKFISNECQELSHIDVVFGTIPGQDYFQFAKVWDGDEINLDGVNVTFMFGDTAWQPGDLPIPVEPGDVIEPISEEVTGLPENCTYTSDLPDSFTVPGGENGNYENVQSLIVIDNPREGETYTLTATNTVDCEEGEVLAEEDTPEGAVDAGMGNIALLGLVASGAVVAGGITLARKQTN